MSSQFKQRLLMSTIGVGLLFIIIYFSYSSFFRPIFILFSAGIVSLALLEYYQLTQQKGFAPLISGGLACTILYIPAVYLSLQNQTFAFFPSFILFLFLILIFFPFFNKQAINPVENLAITAFGIAYLTIPLSFMIKINYFFTPENIQDGRLWLAYILVITKMTDVGAYFFGKTIGKHKLAPHISPKKTNEGALGGLLVAVITSFVFYFFSSASLLQITGWQSIWLGCLISLTAQFGDLAESILKRDARIKDSSSLPGLGGILDIVDSLVFTLPLMYFILKMGILG